MSRKLKPYASGWQNSRPVWESQRADRVALAQSGNSHQNIAAQKCIRNRTRKAVQYCSAAFAVSASTRMPARLRTNLPRKTKKAAARPSTTKRTSFTPRRYPEANTSLWTEALFGAEILILHATPVYYGLGVPRGDGSAVVIIPGFLGTDLYLTELHAWLGRIGYRPYFSGIGINAECPNLLIQRRLNQTIDQALAETGRKIHLIGHSLGGVIARSLAGQRPKDVASVITLAAPFPGP